MNKNIEIAISRIEKARSERLRFLDLRGLHLSEIPVDISDMIYLFDIDLSFNNLTEFPEVLSELDDVQILNLSHNYLQDVRFKLGVYYSLNEIDISNNYINIIPDSLGYLNKDVKILFHNNPFLNGLPPELEDQEDLLYVKFYFDSIEKEDKRKRLFETKLLMVGKGDVGKTTLIKSIDNFNYKVKVGKEKTTHGINIQTIRKEVLFPAKKPFYNRVEDFNNLHRKEYQYLSDIDDEDLDDMQEISNDEPIEVYEPISHLISALDDEERLELQYSSEPGDLDPDLFFSKEIKINMWDFGGQEIMYSTHQFFLTQRSIYIFVWEPRADNEEESFEYWLNIIQRLSNGSPVIVVMNKSDIRIKNIDETSYKKKFKNIVGFHNISCKTKEGINVLNKQILDSIVKLPHIGDLLPLSWDKIRAKLKNTYKDYISYNDFKEICDFGVGELHSNEKNLDYLSGYLNDLGDVIHFKSDIGLRDLVIINPSWLTQAIYELIHSKEIQRNNGLFSTNQLEHYLDTKLYPLDKHHQILLLMEKFEICFKITGSNNLYIIPALLKANIDDENSLDKFKTPESLKFHIDYSFMPSGIIERLICKLNNYVDSSNFWKYGAVFNTEYNNALVLSNRIEKKIYLYAIGEVKTNLFNIIRHELYQIHQDLKLKKEDLEEMLACNCNFCSSDLTPHMFNKETLHRFLSKGKRHIDCHKSADRVEIEEILSGYKSEQTKKPLIRDFVDAFTQLQFRHKLLKNFDEDGRNTYLNDLLKPYLLKRGFISQEQARRGKSESGKKAGELDIEIEESTGKPISLFEGFNLDSIRKEVIDRHIHKTIINYDSSGLKEKFIGIYSEASNFSNMANKYFEHIKKVNIDNIKLINTEDLSKVYVKASEIRVFRSTYQRNEETLLLYHILVNLNL